MILPPSQMVILPVEVSTRLLWASSSFWGCCFFYTDHFRERIQTSDASDYPSVRSWWIRPWESVIPKDRSALTKRGIREFRTSDYVQVISLWLECELVRNKESVSKKM